MRILAYDLETTGLNPKEDRITELGFVLWDTDLGRPLTCIDVLYYEESYPKLTPEIVRLTGITDEMLKEFGTDPKANLIWLEGFCKEHKIDYMCAHNGRAFDGPFLTAALDRYGIEAPYLRSLQMLDTKEDLPFASEPDSRKLKHLALDIGVINHFPHRAITDVLTMCLILAHYKIEDVIAYKNKKRIIVRALVPHPKQDNGRGKDIAKGLGYRWQEINYNKNYPLCWVKMILEENLDAEKTKLSEFQVVKIDEV